VPPHISEHQCEFSTLGDKYLFNCGESLREVMVTTLSRVFERLEPLDSLEESTGGWDRAILVDVPLFEIQRAGWNTPAQTVIDLSFKITDNTGRELYSSSISRIRQAVSPSQDTSPGFSVVSARSSSNLVATSSAPVSPLLAQVIIIPQTPPPIPMGSTHDLRFTDESNGRVRE